MHMTEVETHKARKAHRCEWCWQRIDEGAEYKRYRYYDGGEAATIKMHPECMGAMQDEAAEWGGDFEWTPGQERPKVGAGETANDRIETRVSGIPAKSESPATVAPPTSAERRRTATRATAPNTTFSTCAAGPPTGSQKSLPTRKTRESST